METMHFHIAKISCIGQIVRILGGQMNNMAYMRNCPEGCMVDQIRSRVIVTSITFIFTDT